MDLACASEPNAYEGCAIITPSDLDMRRLDKVDIVAATHEVELNPPQHARVDRIGEDHLNPMRSQRAMGIAPPAHAHLCVRTQRRRGLARHRPNPMRAGKGGRELTRFMKFCAAYLKYDVAMNPRARYCLPGVKNSRAAASSWKPVPAPIQ